MKTIPLLLTAILFFFSLDISQGQERQTYTHPGLDFSFSSSGKWENNSYHKDKMIYEMVNAETGIHVMLWYNGGTESTCEKYLVKMADMKGLNFEGPVEKEGDEGPWALRCTGVEDGTAIVKILAALSYVEKYGPDVPERSKGKTYNAMHIAQVWCPEDRYEANKKMMQDIVTSLALAKK